MKKYLLCIFLLSASIAFAQTRISDHNTIGWYGVFLTKNFNKKIGAHLEYQWRRNNIITDWQQSLFRTGINYKLNPNLTAHIGYAWIETFPYGDIFIASIAKRFPEHRIYEQLTLHDNIGKSAITHRMRIEQRWIGRYTNINSTKPDVTLFVNRIRYMPKVEVPFNSKLYASLFDEIFIGFGKNVGENIFDQNRIGIMLGLKATPAIKIEGGFINQTIQLGREINNKNVFQYNNGIVLNTFFTLN